MPTLLVQDGFKFFFYANEHQPLHVHVQKAIDLTRVHKSYFVRKWHEFFAQR